MYVLKPLNPKKRPAQRSHVLVVNPTKFLGNLLIALGVIQSASVKLTEQHKTYTLIFDESFKSLVENLFCPGTIIYYPRSAIKNATYIGKAKLYSKFVCHVRRLSADKAVDLEGDSVSRMLTRLSGATTRIGPADCLRPNWYHQTSEPRNDASEFFKYRNTMACAADVSNLAPAYGKLNIPKIEISSLPSLMSTVVTDLNKIIVLHAGASKARKLWPTSYWIQLVRLLINAGYKPVLIGAGEMDSKTNYAINTELDHSIPDLVNKLDLPHLAGLLKLASFYIGNDSGPMHLATALGIPAIAIFGPTNNTIWGPLGDNTSVMRGFQCPTQCRNGHDCELEYKCLRNLSAQAVFDQFKLRVRTPA